MNITATFYLNQSANNIKKSILTIISLGLAISLITGITLYFNGANYYNLSQKFVNIYDISLLDQYSHPESSLNFSDRFEGEEPDYLKEARRSRLDLESIDQYTTISSSNLLLFKNYSQSEDIPAGLAEFESSQLSLSLFNKDFFATQRFQDYFQIIEGYAPQNENEIIIDALLASHLNLQVQTYSALPIFIKTSMINDTSSFSWENVKIVGIFTPKRSTYAIGTTEFFNTPYTSSDDILLSNLYQYGLVKTPIFGLIDYEQDSQREFHSFNIFFNNLNCNSRINNSITYQVEKGIGLSYDRKAINVNTLSSEVQRIGSQVNALSNEIPSNIIIRNNIDSAITGDLDKDIEKRAKIALTTIPVIIFSLFLGSIAINLRFKSRFDEFLYMRTKGMPKNVIRNQLLLESLMIGIVASLISILLAIGVFYIVQPWLNGQFLHNYHVQIDRYGTITHYYFNEIDAPPSTLIPLIFRFGTFVTNFLYCITLAALGSIYTFYKLKRLKIHQMQAELDKNGLNSLYSELIYEESGKLDAENNGKDHNLYETPIEKAEKKISKWGLKLIIPTLIPFVITLIYLIGTIPSIPDVFLEISAKIEEFSGILSVLSFLMPVLLIIGIVRYFVVESPIRFARVSKKIASCFMKEHSTLIGLELIRRKPYRQMIFLLSLFASLLVFANVNINTVHREDLIKDNFETGADIQIKMASPFNQSDKEDGFTPMILNVSSLELFEENLLKIQNQNGDLLINSVVSLVINNYQQKSFWWMNFGIEDRGMVSYLDFTKYLAMISENGYLIPNRQLVLQIQDIIDFNQNSANSIPGVIVNHDFLENHNVEVGNVIEIQQHTYEVSDDFNETIPIQVKILQEVNLLPGITPDFITSKDQGSWYGGGAFDGEMMLIDRQFLNTSFKQVQIGQLKVFLDVDMSILENLENLTQEISKIAPPNLHAPTFTFYDHEWNSLTQNSFTLQPSAGYTSTAYFSMLYINLLIIGFLCTLGLAITNLNFQRENEQFHGLMLVRGFGKKKLVGFVITQLVVIFSLSLFIGLVGGFITSWAWMKSYSITGGYGSWSVYKYNLPVMFNFPELALVLGVLVGFSFLLYFTSTYFRMRKPINQYFYKF
ncbi:hypothetical protein NEF87_003116 [Candidatus Lokiarchaeum ossiferum]|uniref:ABC3 transporter permease C-terminal domain-containing protein n=1 Tax=Candidatus Lokiarchaeum ossiferum TaxID=2951803 RepID=A0ABY6HW70_9ARCH|nr:hypothetical protein NEF87_003116 [Candidatus Lokiarchaeum sp. B-35]